MYIQKHEYSNNIYIYIKLYIDICNNASKLQAPASLALTKAGRTCSRDYRDHRIGVDRDTRNSVPCVPICRWRSQPV